MNKLDIFERPLAETPIVKTNDYDTNNRLYIKRDDMIPFSFGGNKARKAAQFYREIQKNNADVVMTYGSNSSNHCRIIANMAAAMGVRCHVISPNENREVLYNTKMVENFGATIETCAVTDVADTIASRIESYKEEGFNPYFITGGGHGNPGTHSYVLAYDEIVKQEEAMGIHFDYIFHASGTGATQAGLVCGKLLKGDERQIVGISIAREECRGRDVVKESIKDYLGDKFNLLYHENDLIFTDKYRLNGYGDYNQEIKTQIDKLMLTEGIPMDTTYVGKAYYGMCQYLKDNDIKDKNILFIHTGGTPLFFDKL